MKRFNHWSEGGDGITNFERKDLARYELAIKRYGDSDLYIGEQMPVPSGLYWMLALRCKKMKDLSKFWDVFSQIKDCNFVDDSKVAKYKTQPIDYTGCDPVIAEHLKSSEEIWCEVWGDDDLGKTRVLFVSKYSQGEDEPYESANSMWQYAKPVEQQQYVKKASEIVKWLEGNGYSVSAGGNWHGDYKLSFAGEMFRYCGKKHEETNSKHKWLSEWLECK